MDQQILVPDIGDYRGVEVIEVVAKIGDNLKKDDTMITLETDKATMDIPAPMDLTINQLHVKPGDKVAVTASCSLAGKKVSELVIK